MTTETQNRAGRLELDIDWKKVDFLLEAGCPGTEVASQLGCHFETLYDRVEKKYGMPFSHYSQERRQKGDASIRAVQYQKALKGDNHMLIWLGKNRLKQKDKEEVASVKLEDLATLAEHIRQGKISQQEHVTD